MEGSSIVSELLMAFEVIRSSDVVEGRTELILKLGDLDIRNKSDISLLLENLILTFWEDFTCLDVSQCNLNKAILLVASKYLKSDTAGVWVSFLILGTKASMWSRKHLKMTLMSMEESQEEEHCTIFYQLLMELLNFSAASFSTLTPSPEEKTPLNVVKSAILEQLDLTKDSLTFIKQEVFQPYCSDVLKMAQLIVDSIVKLCGKYWQYRNSVELEKHPGKDKGNMDCDGVADFNPIIDILKCTIEKLAELGIVAANDGGSLVGVLNVSWKGVVTLLQQGKEELDASLQVSDIILRLISLVNNALRCADESWCSSSKEPVLVAEARRTFIPVKFYLVNAVKISSLYPVQAYLVHEDLSKCAVMISNLRISMSNAKHLKVASEVASELLEQTTLNLLYSILNSSEIKQEMKFEILDNLFTNQGCCDTTLHEDLSGQKISIAVNDKFLLDGESTNTSCKGRVLLFVCFLRCSHGLEEDAKLGITKKMRWLFDMLVDEEVYSYILSVQVPLLYPSKKNTEAIWEPVFFSLLQSLKTFMIVAASSGRAVWKELQSFMLENFFHPHFLCSEIITELFCFLVRYAEEEVGNDIIDKLFSCFKLTICAESILDPKSATRKTARSICRMVACGTQPLADRVYSHAVGGSRLHLSSFMLVCLLMEGFSIDMLSHKLKEVARKKLITDYYGFIGSLDEKLLGADGSGLLGAPVFALSACLPSVWAGESDIEEKTLKLLVSITESCIGSKHCRSIDCRNRLLVETLGIVSNMKNLYISDEMEEIVVKLHNMFISKSKSEPSRFHNCKAGLALFGAGLGHMQMTEVDESRKSSSVCELYHMLLREQHWALVHLVLTAFGYFAARTSCNQLWRFVPPDAALSYDLSSTNGSEPSEQRFMGEFKSFLEKEMALKSLSPSLDQVTHLRKEAALLRAVESAVGFEHSVPMEIDIVDLYHEEASAKRRKVPDGICKGMEMLQNGVKAIHDGLSQWQEDAPPLPPGGAESQQLHGKFLTHFSSLKDVIMNLASSIAGGD